MPKPAKFNNARGPARPYEETYKYKDNERRNRVAVSCPRVADQTTSASQSAMSRKTIPAKAGSAARTANHRQRAAPIPSTFSIRTKIRRLGPNMETQNISQAACPGG